MMLMPPKDARDWVPQSVLSIASALPLEGDVARRLLTDQRMKEVWRILRRAKVSQQTINALPGWRRLAETQGVPLEDQACAAFFAYAVMELSNRREIGTRSQFDAFARPWFAAAELCRWVTENEPRVRIDPEFAQSIARVGVYFEDEGRSREQKGSPYVLERSSGQRNDDGVRGRVRALATEMHKMFGHFFYRTVATVAMIAMQVDDIDEHKVRNWCSDLRPSAAPEQK